LFKLNFLEGCGWAGAILLLGAYALNSYGLLISTGLAYQAANLAGSLILMYYTYQKKAYPNTVLNVVWALIGVVAIARLLA
jgi:hypothetical protein